MATRARPHPSNAAAAETKRLWTANACIVALTIAATFWAVLAYAPGPQRVEGTRGIAMLLAALYGAAHVIVMLRAASSERRSVSSPLRISCLDLAIYWLLIYLLAPRFL
jgi:hypothetical protein